MNLLLTICLAVVAASYLLPTLAHLPVLSEFESSMMQLADNDWNLFLPKLFVVLSILTAVFTIFSQIGIRVFYKSKSTSIAKPKYRGFASFKVLRVLLLLFIGVESKSNNWVF